jgi:hypothetical protein
VTLLVVASALAAAGVLTWLHLRPRGIRLAEAVPSLQHLHGPSPHSKRALPLEEAAPWALRVAMLLLAVAGVWASRSGCAADVRPLTLVDSATAEKAWAEARVRTGAEALLGFQGEVPLTVGDVPGQVEAALRACSDTRAACLLRAADTSGRPVVVFGAFEAAEWRLALARRARPFFFVRTGAGAPLPAGAAPGRPTLARIRLEGTSPAAQVWAAALAVASGEGEDMPASAAPEAPVVVVTEPHRPSGADAEGILTVVAVEAPSPPRPDAPGVEASTSPGLLLPDPLDLAAGTTGLGLRASLAFLPDAHFTSVLGLVAVARAPGKAEVALAATPLELGDWAHQGSLVPLARAVLAAGLPGPTEVSFPPAGGAFGWTDGDGRLAPVGLLDVRPGRYLRSDGRVALLLERPSAPGVAPLDDTELGRLGGHPWTGPGAGRLPIPTLLLTAALLAWLSGVWLTRRARRAWLPAVAVAAGLGLLLLDVRWPIQTTAPWAAVVATPEGGELSAFRRQTDVEVAEGKDASSLPCAAAGASRPCTLLATVGLASAPAQGMDTLVFDAARPRLDVLSVEAPREVPLGTAAEVWATVRVRRAKGQRVTLSARSTSAAPVAKVLQVEAEDEVRTMRLAVSPLSEGVAFVAVEAAVAGEAQAQDGRLLALAARRHVQHRLVLAAAPGWEARAAAGALETQGARVEALSLLGRVAVVAQGRPPQSPRELLGQPEALRGVGLLALVGFEAEDFDAKAAAGLRRFVESGGAALLLDAPGAAAALRVQLPKVAGSSHLQALSGQLDAEEAVHFRGYAPSAALRLPAGVSVLGRLGATGDASPLPWVVGRALGKGRVAVVTAPDVWRVSPPGEGREAYQRLLSRLVGWLEAPRASREGVVLAEDWASLRVEDASGTRTLSLPAAGPVDGLSVDSVDLASFVRWPRARLRAAAAAARHPFLEVEGADALAAAWRRLPAAPRFRQDKSARNSDGAFCVLAALLALEALARRLYGGRGGSGSRARTSPSSEDTGGRTSGEGKSQRASATPASRAAALRETSSFAA